MIEKERIEALKRSVDMVALAEAKGIRMRKSGKSWFGLCPFHHDKDPSFSVTPSKNEWHCFGCGKGGDVIRFIELIDQVDFKEAVKRLTPLNQQQNKHDTHPDLDPVSDPAQEQYLERIVAIYEKNFAQKDPGRSFLHDRGITDAGLFTRHCVGFCDGTLNEILPHNGETLESLKQLGILLGNGSERFLNCVVFPVYDLDGHIITLYGRHTDPASKKDHVFLPQRPTGLWNVGMVKTCTDIILTESIIDALSVMMAGFANVISIQGTNGLSHDDTALLKQYGVRQIMLLLDGDEPGKTSAGRLKEKLSGFDIDIKHLPDNHDPNSYLQKHSAQRLAEFIKTDKLKQASSQSMPVQTLSPEGFVISCGLRHYRIMSLEKSPHKLKATLRLEHAGKLHVDTLDLYSARSRRNLAQDICRIFEEQPETIEADITRMIRECEHMKDDPAKTLDPKPSAPPLTQKEQNEAQTFGRSKDLINNILVDFEICGLIGEEPNKLLGYIAMTSRKRTEPLSVQILSSSGAGKTALQDAVTDFCPPEDLVKLTSLSGKALFYKERMSLKHKVLALEEGDGAEDASYAIRSLISSGVLINETTIKDLSTGRLTTMENRVEGPTAVFYTTTNPDIDPETRSRFFVTGIDESREQTRRILAFQRDKHQQDESTQTLKTGAVIKKHQNFQRLLKPVGVKNPYSHKLQYNDDRLQGRRDQPKYLGLIKAVAFLRQMQKQVKHSQGNGKSIPYIEVDPEDIRIANKLAHEVLGRSLDELSRPGRDLLMLLDEMIEEIWKERCKPDKSVQPIRTDITFTRRDIREYTGWSNARVHRYLKELVDLEYVLIHTGKNGSQYRYHLAYEGQGKDGEKFMLGLTPVEELM